MPRLALLALLVLGGSQHTAARTKRGPARPTPPSPAADAAAQVGIALRRDTRRTRDSVVAVEFCLGCESPALEGSHLQSLTAAQGIPSYDVSSTLTYAVPNDARRALMNRKAVKGTVVLIDRGGDVPMVDKVMRAQEAGALAVVLVDQSHDVDDRLTCNAKLECGAAGNANDGFAKRDDPYAWRKVAIPAVLVTTASGDRLKRLLALEQMEIPKLGVQFISPEDGR
jgi:hypothetical protein